jgi:hypothetical protein
LFLHQDSVNTWTNVQNIFSVRFLLVTVYVFENIVIMIPTSIDFLFMQLQWLTYVGFFHIGSVRACILIFAFDISVKWTYILETMMHRFPSIRQTVSSDLKKTIFFNLLAQTTGTCFNQKIYAPSSSLLQGKHYPFLLPHFASIFFPYLWSFYWPNYIVTLPRYFSFRLPHLNITTGPPQTNRTRIVSERGLVKISVIETDAATSGPV